MSPAAAEPLNLAVGAQRFSALLLSPPAAIGCYVFAHGAGAGMSHPFMEAIAHGLAERGIATLRYQFPFMERGARRPDPPALAQAAVRAAVTAAGRALPGRALIAGGKSFGGRMTSQAQAAAALPGVRGLAFLGFPLHAAGQPSNERARHLFAVRIPMLFVQGTRDALADSDLVSALIERLGKQASLKLIEGADHSFGVSARSGRGDREVRSEMLDCLAAWSATQFTRSSD
jgi:predicted alpha/beta-hydrolase family hydrolase